LHPVVPPTGVAKAEWHPRLLGLWFAERIEPCRLAFRQILWSRLGAKMSYISADMTIEQWAQ